MSLFLIITLFSYLLLLPRRRNCNFALKGRQCHQMNIFWRSKHFIQYLLSACLRWRFSRFSKSFFSLLYTIITFLFASLKLLTNAYWNTPQSYLVCDWSMFSCADLSRINFSHGASGMILQDHRRLTRLFLVFSKNLLLFSLKKININVYVHLSSFIPSIYHTTQMSFL
jgi:hypothetical protein